MSRRQSLSWFYRLDRGEQARLLANPHGYLPGDVAGRITAHTVAARGDESSRAPRQWLLRAAEANLLEDERLRLDVWWSDLSAAARSSLIASRGSGVPREHREAVLDVVPGGLPAGVDLDIAFPISGIAAAYLEMITQGSEGDS